jgi:hypothetical protein
MICMLAAVGYTSANSYGYSKPSYQAPPQYGGMMQPSQSPQMKTVPNTAYYAPITWTAPGQVYNAQPVTYVAPQLSFSPPQVNYQGQLVTYSQPAAESTGPQVLNMEYGNSYASQQGYY